MNKQNASRVSAFMAVMMAGLVSAAPARAELTWASTNQYGQKVVQGFNDEASIRGAGCLDWSQILSANDPDELVRTGFSIAYEDNRFATEFGAPFHVRATAAPQEFDLWVLAHDDGLVQGSLQVRMREVTDPNQTEGFDPDSEIPIVAGSEAMVDAAGGTEPCWRHARIVLPEVAREGDYYFTLTWSPERVNSFEFVVDNDSLNGGLTKFRFLNPQRWFSGRIDPMIVISQELGTAVSCEPPIAKIVVVASDPAETGDTITVDGSSTVPGLGGAPTYAWTFVSRPTGSQATFNDSSAAVTTFNPDVEGDYVVQLEASKTCGSDTEQRTIHAEEVVLQVQAPTLSPDRVHAGDEQRLILLSVVATDPGDADPNLVHSWNLVRRDTGQALMDFDDVASPNRKLLRLGLGDQGPGLDTFYDVTVMVTNTDTGRSATSPAATLTISQVPQITFTIGETFWGEDMTYNVPITVTVHAFHLAIDSGATTTLRLLDLEAGGLVIDEVVDPFLVTADPNSDALLLDVLTLHDRLEWDTGFCWDPRGPQGDLSVMRDIQVQALNLVDENGFGFNSLPIPSANSIATSIAVPSDPKIEDYYEAVHARLEGIGETILGFASLIPPTCPPCAVIEFSAQAAHMLYARLVCTDAHDDPPGIDPNFGVVVPAEPQEFDSTAAVAPDEASRLGMVAAEQAFRIRGARGAYDQTYNKLFGGYGANDLGGMLLQGVELIRQGGVLDREYATLGANLRAAQEAVGVPSADEIVDLQDQVATSGLPQREIDVLQQLGADQQQIDAIEAELLSVDPNLFATPLPDDMEERLSSRGGFYARHSRGIAPGGFVLVALIDPRKGQPVHGTVDVQGRVVHKKEATTSCLCGPTLITDLKVDAQIVSSVNYPPPVFPGPPPSWCPAPPGPFPQALPFQLDTTTLTDGSHTVTVTAKDSGLCQPVRDPREHTNTDTITFSVDNTPPTSTITSPDADPNRPGLQVLAGDDITYTADDPVVSGYSSGLVDPFQGVFPTDFGVTLSATVRVADRAGNTASDTVEVLADTDGDRIADVSDPDDDNDGVADGVDNCPLVSNLGQADTDLDGQGDACDACPQDALNDTDHDGVCCPIDNCCEVANPAQADTDADGVGDACDPCPSASFCDDGNPCTLDVCDPQAGCSHEPTDTGQTNCGVGACSRTVDNCLGDLPQVCVPGEPGQEECNGVDDDCDGATDEVADLGTTTCGLGVCHHTVDNCLAGVPQTCDPLQGSSAETCDAVDNDCDGLSDEDFPSCGEPASQGFYRRLCGGPHPEGALTPSDADCVNNSATFSWVSTVADLCAVLTPDPASDKCEQAESQFMALLLNRCQGRVFDAQAIASTCSEHSSVGESIAHTDALLANAARTREDCLHAQCESDEINSGEAAGSNTLRIDVLPSGNVFLTWAQPPVSAAWPAPVAYRVWRRSLGAGAFELLAEVPGFSHEDTTAGPGSYEYQMTTVRR